MKVRRQFHTNVDIVVVLDVTGSMEWCIKEIVDHVCGFAGDLVRLQNIWRLGLYAFRDLKIDEPARVFPFTQDVTEFQSWLRAQSAEGGGGNDGESSIDALFDAIDSYDFRRDAGRYFLLFTDEPPHDPDKQGRSLPDLLEALQRDHIVTYVVSERIPPFLTLADGTGGFHFNIQASRGEFRSLFFNLSQSITTHALDHKGFGSAARAAIDGRKGEP